MRAAWDGNCECQNPTNISFLVSPFNAFEESLSKLYAIGIGWKLSLVTQWSHSLYGQRPHDIVEGDDNFRYCWLGPRQRRAPQRAGRSVTKESAERPGPGCDFSGGVGWMAFAWWLSPHLESCPNIDREMPRSAELSEDSSSRPWSGCVAKKVARTGFRGFQNHMILFL